MFFLWLRQGLQMIKKTNSNDRAIFCCGPKFVSEKIWQVSRNNFGFSCSVNIFLSKCHLSEFHAWRQRNFLEFDSEKKRKL